MTIKQRKGCHGKQPVQYTGSEQEALGASIVAVWIASTLLIAASIIGAIAICVKSKVIPRILPILILQVIYAGLAVLWYCRQFIMIVLRHLRVISHEYSWYKISANFRAFASTIYSNLPYWLVFVWLCIPVGVFVMVAWSGVWHIDEINSMDMSIFLALCLNRFTLHMVFLRVSLWKNDKMRPTIINL